jgi:hypothetical protein
VLNGLQAEFGMAPAAEGGKAKCSTAAFPKLFTMSRPSLRTVAPLPCLPLDIKDSLKEDMRLFDGGF